MSDIDVLVAPSFSQQLLMTNLTGHPCVVIPNGSYANENPGSITGEFQAIAQATKDRPEAKQIHMMLLRSMQQAIYTPINNGHFGLAFDAYTHFTSPIRRYPDLLVHRAIKAILAGKKYSLPDSLLTMKRPPMRKKPAGAVSEKPKKPL